MQKIAIYGQFLHEETLRTTRAVLSALLIRFCTAEIESNFMQLLRDSGADLPISSLKSFSQLDDSHDLLISIGGDGSILRAVAFIGKKNIPVMGINTGRLGFLATVPHNEVSSCIQALFDRNYSLSRRSLITATSSYASNHAAPSNFALNEISVSRMNTTSMIQIDTFLNNELLTSYWADGLIISTPTGSTGYSLSCGGPLISPATSAFVITPIAPHNLNARPLVIPDDTSIMLRVRGREDEFLMSLDNRIASYPNHTEIHLKKSPFTIDFVEMAHHSFIDTIRHKLLWGEDHRNRQ